MFSFGFLLRHWVETTQPSVRLHNAPKVAGTHCFNVATDYLVAVYEEFQRRHALSLPKWTASLPYPSLIRRGPFRRLSLEARVGFEPTTC